MARGEAPWSNLLPMSVIVKILEAEAPKLEGDQWSTEFKNIVEQLLKK